MIACGAAVVADEDLLVEQVGEAHGLVAFSELNDRQWTGQNVDQ
jgi:hypothetical protein